MILNIILKNNVHEYLIDKFKFSSSSNTYNVENETIAHDANEVQEGKPKVQTKVSGFLFSLKRVTLFFYKNLECYYFIIFIGAFSELLLLRLCMNEKSKTLTLMTQNITFRLLYF